MMRQLSTRHVVAAGLVLVVPWIAACRDLSSPTGEGREGDACDSVLDCVCWQCTCSDPQQSPKSRRCIAGECPSGQAACDDVCAMIHESIDPTVSPKATSAVPIEAGACD